MADPDLQIREGVGGGGGGGKADRDPDIREGGRSPKKFFRPFGPQCSLKIRGGGSPAFCLRHVFFEHAKYILDSVPIK